MNLTHIELENLRHLISSHSLAEKKLNFYAQQCQDPQLKQMIEQSAQSACDTRKKLMSFLG